MYVDGSVCGLNLVFLVDTGANITIISPEVYSKLPEDTRPTLQRVLTGLTLADGSELPFTGKAAFTLTVQGHVCQHEVWVAGIAGDGIIGHDFLKKFDCHISVGEGILSIEGQRVSCKEDEAGLSSCRVEMAENTVLPPRSEVMATGVVRGNLAKQKLAMVEMSDYFMKKHNVLVARAVVDPSEGKVPVRLMNITDEPKTIYKGSTIGDCVPVEPVDRQAYNVSVNDSATNHPKSNSEKSNPDEGEVPQHLTNLYNRSCRFLKEEDRKTHILGKVHEAEPEVQKIVSISNDESDEKEKERERKKLLALLKNRGDNDHNKKILNKKRGE
ncbi:hypothetical protein HOLleu_00722 [Holothuria leucospilota]|uniref:Peptidase A2 domain-containing protein n=1 Tax=Holothuria leucospilota TaxID=206669 RepID=A0A9Q1CPC8_HOLLE|nr:hypothetical protein HOLleu_00722 [Holothuria leucospilota]